MIKELSVHWGCTFLLSTATKPAFEKADSRNTRDPRWSSPRTLREIIVAPIRCTRGFAVSRSTGGLPAARRLSSLASLPGPCTMPHTPPFRSACPSVQFVPQKGNTFMSLSPPLPDLVAHRPELRFHAIFAKTSSATRARAYPWNRSGFRRCRK
jgi:hypothetical protein